MDDFGASDKSDRAGHEQSQQAVSAETVAIPSAGDIGIIEHPLIYERHILARVVKARPSGMWEVELWERGFGADGPQWSRPQRRKVRVWHRLPAEIEPTSVSAAIREMGEALFREERARRQNYHDSIRDYAQAMSAGTAETQSGSGRQPASAVRQDAPETQSPETNNVR